MNPESTTLFDTALRHAAAVAGARYPGEQDRIDRGLVLALNGHVALLDGGGALVRSGRDAEVVYRVQAGVCDCPDAARAPDGRCKHKIAASLVRFVQTKQCIADVREPGDEAPEAAAEFVELPVDDELPPLALATEQYEPAPVEGDDTLVPFLPEAGASLNIKLRLPGGAELMYTLRAHGDDDILTRLPKVLAGLETVLKSDTEKVGWFRRIYLAVLPPSHHQAPDSE